MAWFKHYQLEGGSYRRAQVQWALRPPRLYCAAFTFKGSIGGRKKNENGNLEKCSAENLKKMQKKGVSVCCVR